MGASLLVFKNKSDLAQSMDQDEVIEVRSPGPLFAASSLSPSLPPSLPRAERCRRREAWKKTWLLTVVGPAAGVHPHPYVEDCRLQRIDRAERRRRPGLGCGRRQGEIVPVLIIAPFIHICTHM